MGNKKFRLSEMMPNAWFYKLKDMGSRTRNPKNTINPLTKKKKQPPTSSSSSSSSSTSSLASLSISTSSFTTTSIPPQNSKLPNQPHDILSHQRKSYYFTRDLNPPPQPPPIQDPKSQETHFPVSPRKSFKQYPEIHFPESPGKSPKQKRSKNSRRRSIASINRPSSQKLITNSVSTSCSCRASLDLKSDDYPISSLESSSDLESLLPELGSDHDQNHRKDIIIDINDNSSNAKSEVFSRTIPKVELQPIITKKQPESSNSVESEERYAHGHRYIGSVTEQRNSSVSSVRRLSVSSPGVRIRTNSPRIGSRRIQGNGRKIGSASISGGRSRRSVSESFAVVKSSSDPKRDFRESMVEMILENNIRSSKDLEDLLACYLQLNSDDYHEMIIKVFKQIWFDLANVRLK